MIEVQDISDQQIWNDSVRDFEEVNFLQSWEWGEFHISRGLVVFRRGVYQNGVLVGMYTGQIEKARRGKYLAIAGGPLLKNWQNKELVGKVFKDIRDQASIEKCDFVRIRPQIAATEQNIKLFEGLGLKHAPMPLSVEFAGVIDLNKSDEQIMADMSQSLRRKIRKAQSAGIDIKVTDTLEDLESFVTIHNQHAKRQGYVPFSRDFITKQFNAFKSTKSILIYSAIKEGKILAQNYVIFFGPEASYHYGVSTDEGVLLSSAPLLHLAAINEARIRGCIRYNFWGIVDENDTKHRYFGVSQFKRSFGVEGYRYVRAHDLIINKVAYLKNWLIEKARRRLRKL